MSEQNIDPSIQDSYPIDPISLPKSPIKGEIEAKRPLQYYEKLMRHDAHCKVGGRVRQRRWGR